MYSFFQGHNCTPSFGMGGGALTFTEKGSMGRPSAEKGSMGRPSAVNTGTTGRS